MTLLLLACAPKAPPPPPPGRSAGLVEVTGVTTRVPVRQLLMDTLATLSPASCYQGAIERDPLAHGEIVVRFTVGPGVVTDAEIVLSTLNDAPAEACVLDALKALPFPGVTDQTVVYPFVFTSDATPPEVARALKVKYKLLPPDTETVPEDPRDPTPPGVIYLW